MQEIEAQAITSQQQLNITKAQITAKQKNARLLELTSKELSSLPKETKVYEGVGKMYVYCSSVSFFSSGKLLTGSTTGSSVSRCKLSTSACPLRIPR